jgi:hypothetical protein
MTIAPPNPFTAEILAPVESSFHILAVKLDVIAEDMCIGLEKNSGGPVLPSDGSNFVGLEVVSSLYIVAADTAKSQPMVQPKVPALVFQGVRGPESGN